MKLSIVLPVFNVEAYLKRCVESCLNQDLPKKDYEIIIVNDGSTDNSPKIAKQLCDEYNNIKIVNRVNGGLSAARNTGMQVASGDYIWFIDSDDYIEKDVLSRIIDNIERNSLDCLWIQWNQVSENGHILPPYSPHLKSNNDSVMDGYSFMEKVLSTYLFSWSFIFKASFVKQYAFTEGMYYEDTDFAFRFLPKIARIKLLDEKIYNYVQRKTSITSHISEKKMLDILTNAQNGKRLHDENLNNSNRANFFFDSYSDFMLFAVKECGKTGNRKLSNLVENFVRESSITKIKVYGNTPSKFIAIAYNLLGVRWSLFVSRILFKLYFLL